MANKIVLDGDLYGRLRVIGDTTPCPHGRRVLCECACGNRIAVTVRAIRSGITRSCGCLKRELLAARRRTHGRTGTSEYRIWCDMRRRCHDPRRSDYMLYGGRGITVCQRWLDGFDRFYADLGPRPSPRHSLERIDVNGNYDPTNCRWATLMEQGRNQRTTRRLTSEGETLHLEEWARRKQIPSKLIASRLKRGWTAERAITTPSPTPNESVLLAASGLSAGLLFF